MPESKRLGRGRNTICTATYYNHYDVHPRINAYICVIFCLPFSFPFFFLFPSTKCSVYRTAPPLHRHRCNTIMSAVTAVGVGGTTISWSRGRTVASSVYAYYRQSINGSTRRVCNPFEQSIIV